jgi:hypothetical protein
VPYGTDHTVGDLQACGNNVPYGTGHSVGDLQACGNNVPYGTGHTVGDLQACCCAYVATCRHSTDAEVLHCAQSRGTPQQGSVLARSQKFNTKWYNVSSIQI